MENELIRDLESFSELYGVDEMISRFEGAILSLENDKLSLYFSNLKGSNLKRHGDIILKSQNLDTICDFCISHSLEDSKEHVQYLWDSGDAFHNLKYANSIFSLCYRDVSKKEPFPYSEVLKMRRSFEAILNTNNVDGCLDFLQWFQKKSNLVRDGIDYGHAILSSFSDIVNRAEQIILEYGTAHNNYQCVHIMNGLPEWSFDSIHYSDHSKVILDSRNLYDNYIFARDYGNHDDVPVLEHGTVILEDGDVSHNYLFARDVQRADRKKHGEVVLMDGDPTFNYLFARDVEEADVLAHGKVILQNGDSRINYLYARDIPGSDFREHKKIISENPYYAYLLSVSILPREDQDEVYQRVSEETKRNKIASIDEKIKYLKKV